MPIYEYSCSKCANVIEKIQKFSDPVLNKHEGCGGTLTKLISQSSFHLKGSGWYVTDYAKKDSKGDGEAVDDKKDLSTSSSTKDGDTTTGAGKADPTTVSDNTTTAEKPAKTGSNSGTNK